MKLSSSLALLLAVASVGAGCAQTPTLGPTGDGGSMIIEASGGTITGGGGKTGGGGTSSGSGGKVTGAGGAVTGGGGMTGSCTTIATLPSSQTQVDLKTTSAYCFRTDYNISGWSCWNTEGRTITVNGQTAACSSQLPAKSGGYYTFSISAGSSAGMGLNWWGTPGGGGGSGGATSGSGGKATGSGGKATGSGGTMTGSGGTNVGVGGMTGGQDGWASRYWDCCKPACGWSANVKSGSAMKSCSQSNTVLGGFDDQNSCTGGGAYMCWSGVPWQVGTNVSYGFAARGSMECGRCYQLDFTGKSYNGSNANCGGLAGKSMIVQIVNNGGVGGNQFDILIPGGGVGDFNACSKQWGVSDLGAQYGGWLSTCNGSVSCVQNKCSSAFAGKPELLAGCNWFTGWYGGCDNPSLKYKQVTCPSEIKSRSGLSDPG